MPLFSSFVKKRRIGGRGNKLGGKMEKIPCSMFLSEHEGQVSGETTILNRRCIKALVQTREGGERGRFGGDAVELAQSVIHRSFRENVA